MEIKCINDYKTILECAEIHSERIILSLLENGVNLIDDKYREKKYLLRGIKAIIQTVSSKLRILIQTTEKRIDLMYLGEIESMLNIVDWILCKHSGVLSLLTDEGKEFDSEFLKLKGIIAKYADLEELLNIDLGDE